MLSPQADGALALCRVDRLLQPAFGLHANEAVDDVAPFENQERGNTSDAVPLGDAWALIIIQFSNLERAVTFKSKLFDKWRNCPAGRTPRSPKID
jgi:hypothetical protein